MSSKIGLILSMFFVVIFFVLGMDLIMVQTAYSDLDAKSTTISYLIANEGYIDDSFINNINDKYKVNLIYKGPVSPMFGEDVIFCLQKTIKPLILSNKPMTLQIERSTIIGYYG